MILVLFFLFAFLVLFRMPVAVALGIAVTIISVFFTRLPLTMIPHKMISGIDNFVFVAIPLFLLAGRLMNAGGITDRIFMFARICTSNIRGGLAQANVLASIVFAWMSGSAVAAVGGLGEIELKAMKDGGYDAPFASGVIVASSVLGPVIPPSIPFIIYAAMTENSVGKLFLAGIIPGMMLAVGLMILIAVISKRRHYPKDEVPTGSVIKKAVVAAFLPCMLAVIMIGGIIIGWFTPTEAAAVAVAYALILSMAVYRSITWRQLPRIFVESMITTAVVLFIISATAPFSTILAFERAGELLSASVTAFTENPLIILFLINIALLIFGAIMEAGVVLILLIPVLYPLVISLGIDPIHFGVIMVVNLMIGVATPPMGMSLFVMSNISGIKVEQLMRIILPFLIPLIVVLLLITYFPPLSTWLPSLWQV